MSFIAWTMMGSHAAVSLRGAPASGEGPLDGLPGELWGLAANPLRGVGIAMGEGGHGLEPHSAVIDLY